MRTIGIDELHGILLEIAKEFHSICVKNKIPYYMLGGTMLGAIRHKGFIPWDDDMDFGVPREYFETLKIILSKELQEKYGLITIQNSDSILIDIVKIQDNRTVIKELYKENLKESVGINIDIFPLDKALNKNCGWKLRLMSLLRSVEAYRFLSSSTRPWHKKIVAQIIKTILFPLDKLTLIKFINNNLISSSGQYIANHYGAWGAKETVHSDVMGSPVLYEFEDTKLYGVSKFDEYLTSLYGNYLQLPPEDKRHIHIKEMYWKSGIEI